MQELEWNDLYWCLKRAPVPVLELMKKWGDKIICAGGFIRGCVANEPINDMDLFCPDAILAKNLANALHSSVGGFKKDFYETENAITIKLRQMPVQFIHRWTFKSAFEILSSFDFTVACAAFWWNQELNKWDSLCTPKFYPDLAGKRLVYLSPIRNEDAGGSLLRVLKFYQRGYRIPLDSFGAVIARLMEGVNQDKLYGAKGDTHEERVARVITGLLREVDPNIDPSHIAHLPSREEKLD